MAGQKEIVHIHIGACGNEIGSRYWDSMAADHEIGEDGSRASTTGIANEKLHVLFEEKASGTFAPRALLCDIGEDNEVSSGFRNGVLGTIGDDMRVGTCGAPSNGCWGTGATSAAVEELKEAVRRKLEKCESLQGCHIVSSIGGGESSGVTSKLISHCLAEEIPDKVVAVSAVFPKLTGPPGVLYDSVLTMHKLIEYVGYVHCFDSAAMGLGGIRKAPEVHSLVAGALSLLAMPFRYELAGPYSTMAAKSDQLMCFPRHKFLTTAFVDMANTGSAASDVVGRLCDASSLLTPLEPFPEMCYGSAMIVQGPGFDSSSAAGLEQQTKEDPRMAWLGYSAVMTGSPFENYKAGPVKAFVAEGKRAAGVLHANSKGIRPLFAALTQAFAPVFEEKQGIQAYLAAGLDEMDIMEAKSNVEDLVSELAPPTPDEE